MSTNLGFYSQN